jgi:hypothetical protein
MEQNQDFTNPDGFVDNHPSVNAYFRSIGANAPTIIDIPKRIRIYGIDLIETSTGLYEMDREYLMRVLHISVEQMAQMTPNDIWNVFFSFLFLYLNITEPRVYGHSRSTTTSTTQTRSTTTVRIPHTN